MMQDLMINAFVNSKNWQKPMLSGHSRSWIDAWVEHFHQCLWEGKLDGTLPLLFLDLMNYNNSAITADFITEVTNDANILYQLFIYANQQHAWLTDEEIEEHALYDQFIESLAQKVASSYRKRHTDPYPDSLLLSTTYLFNQIEIALLNKNDIICMNETFPISQLGALCLYRYFQQLRYHYNKYLIDDRIKKPFTVFSPTKPAETQKSFLSFNEIESLNVCLGKKIGSQSVRLSGIKHFVISVSCYENGTEKNNLSAISRLMSLLNKSELIECTLYLYHCTNHTIASIAEKLRTVNRLRFYFRGDVTAENSMFLEGLNEKYCQSASPIFLTDIENISPISLNQLYQPEIPSLKKAKLEALLDQEITLQPVATVIGTQNQHHLEMSNAHHTEVSILQSLQAGAEQQAKKQEEKSYDSYYGDKHDLINWYKISAALEPNDINHNEAKEQIGAEILDYRFKNRGIKDLWERLTGPVTLTTQDKPLDKDLNDLYPLMSSDIPKQVSKKLLLTIVRNPQHYQDGISVTHLPPEIGYDTWHGALFQKRNDDIEYDTKSKNNRDQWQIFQPRITVISEADKPNTYYYQLLSESGLPSIAFLHTLQSAPLQLSHCTAWNHYKTAFAALNQFNDKGITQLTIELQQSLDSAAVPLETAMKYFVMMLRFYHYQRFIFDNSEILNQEKYAELKLIQDYQLGNIDALSEEDIWSLPSQWRSDIHKKITLIMNEKMYLVNEQDEQLNTIILTQLKNILSADHLNYLHEISLTMLLRLMGTVHAFKLLELALAQHESATSNLFLVLSAIYQRWGEVGLSDFINVFMKTNLNFVELVRLQAQQMVTALLMLSPAQYHWWQSLSIQHAQQSGYSNFEVLMKAFLTFLENLAVLRLKDSLPVPCPLQEIRSMPVCLQRVLFVLNKSKDPENQLKNLSNTSWGVFGVPYAIQDGLHYLRPEMEINVHFENRIYQLIKQYKQYYISGYHDHGIAVLYSGNLLNINSPEFANELLSIAIPLYYRAIAKQAFAAPVEIYQEYLDIIQLPQFFTVAKNITIEYKNKQCKLIMDTEHCYPALIVCVLLRLLAHALTGERALENLPKTKASRTEQLNQFLYDLYECSIEHEFIEYRNELYQQHQLADFNLILNNLYELADCCNENYNYDLKKSSPRLHLDELRKVIKVIYLAIQNNNKVSNENYQLRWNLNNFISNCHPECQYTLFTTVSSLFKTTTKFVHKYHEQMLFAIIRFYDCNLKTGNYSVFLVLVHIVENCQLSKDSQRRLIAFLSVTLCTLESAQAEMGHLQTLITSLMQYKKTFAQEALDELLYALSWLTPTGDERLSIQTVNEMLKNAQAPLNADQITTYYIKNHKIDPDVDDIKDTDFYQNRAALEDKYGGLGCFYRPIKRILLQQYKVTAGHPKKDAWERFLQLIHTLPSQQLREEMLDAIGQSNHSTLSLTQLNNWLAVLLESYRRPIDFSPALFSALSTKLVEHVQYEQFFKLIEEWFFHVPKNLIKAEHLNFIHLLNKLINFTLSKSAIDTLSLLIPRYLSLREEITIPWHDNVVNLVAVTKQDQFPMKSFSALLLGLDEAFSIRSKFKENDTDITTILVYLIENIASSWPIFVNIISAGLFFNQQALIGYLLILSYQKSDFEKTHQYLINMENEHYIKLINCYICKPVPLPSLFDKLIKEMVTINEFVLQHERDPHDHRTELVLHRQFNDDLLWQHFERIRLENLDTDARYELYQNVATDFASINQMGYEQWRISPMPKISHEFVSCREAYAIADNPEQKHRILLQALSLIREAIYKTSASTQPLWPTPVQILAILLSIRHHALKTEPLFIQVATGEGKSLIELMQGLMQWVTGKNVAIVMHRASIALRDANAFKTLFHSLCIESFHLTPASYDRWKKKRVLTCDHTNSAAEHALQGVFYVSFPDLALVLQQSIIESKSYLNNFSFVLDEADDLLHILTENNLTLNDGSMHDHPYQWVFEAIAKYFTDKPTTEELTVTIRDLLNFIRLHYPLCTQISDDIALLEKLPKYLEAGWLAKSLKENTHFVPKPLNTDNALFYAAVILEDKPMPPDVSFISHVQPALHGLLNLHEKNNQKPRKFFIPPETTQYSTMSPLALFKWMISAGMITAMSATTGSAAECRNWYAMYGFHFIKLPKLHSMRRTDYPEKFCANKTGQLKSITNICESYIGVKNKEKSYAILITVDTVDFADELFTYLMNIRPTFKINVLHAAKDLNDELITAMEIQSGEPNSILIAMTGIIGRGFDVKLKVRKSIIIATALSTEVIEEQKKGRVSRFNPKTNERSKGKFYGIYDLEAEQKRHPHLQINTDHLAITTNFFKSQHFLANTQHQSEIELHHYLAWLPKDAIQSHFNALLIRFSKDASLSMKIDELLQRYSRLLAVVMAIMPDLQFTDNTDYGKYVRDKYNLAILNLYFDGLDFIQSLIPDFETSIEKQRLQIDIVADQEKLIDLHKNTLSSKPNHPAPMCYSRWKEGVPYNAYLSSGKQHTLNYVSSLFKAAFLPHDTKKMLADGKEKLELEIDHKRKKHADFITPLRLSMTITLNHKPFQMLQNLRQFQHKLNAESRLIISVHPTTSLPTQLTLCSSELAEFEKLQAAIHDYYHQFELSCKLPFTISKGKIDHVWYFEINIDLTHASLEKINKKKMVEFLNHKMRTDNKKSGVCKSV